MMGRRGPAKTPSNIVALKGNPGKRAINRKEPKPASKVPSCPDFVTGHAKDEWSRIVGQLDAVGLVTGLDRASLAAYCVAFNRWVEAEKTVMKHGTMVKSPNGFPMVSPALSIATKAMDQMLRIAREFGMTPSARASIQVEKPDDAIDPAESFFA